MKKVYQTKRAGLGSFSVSFHLLAINHKGNTSTPLSEFLSPLNGSQKLNQLECFGSGVR